MKGENVKQLTKVGALVVLMGALAGSRVGAADDPVASADKALMTAFEKGDKAALRGETPPSNEQIAFASLMRGVHW